MQTLEHEVLTRLKQICVYIDVDGIRGTGYLIGAKHIATACHVVKAWAIGEGHEVIIGERAHGIRRHATLLDKNSGHDAAVLELDEKVPVTPLPVAQGLKNKAVWESFGFPAVIDNAGKILQMIGEEAPPAGGIPFDGLVKDTEATNDLGQPAILLASGQIGGAPLQGFSGAAVVVGGAVIGHLTRFIPTVEDQEKGTMDLVYACPISSVLAMLDFQPTVVRIDALAEKEPGSEAFFDSFFQEMDWSGDEEKPPPCPISDWVDEALLSLALEQSATDKVRDQFAGTAVAAARAALDEADKKGNREIAALSALVERTGNELRETENKIKRIEGQPAPTMPVYPALSEGINGELHKIHYQRYLSEMQEYDLLRKRVADARAMLPALRDDAKRMQQSFNQERFSLESYRRDVAEHLEQLRAAIEAARGPDIETLLSKLLRQVPEGPTENAVVRRFLNMLLVCSLGNVARPWLGASWQAVDRFVKTAEDNIEFLIKRSYEPLGTDLARRIAFVAAGSIGNAHRLDALRSTLDAASNEKLRQALAQAAEKLQETVPPSPDNEALVDPREIASKIAEFDHTLGVLDAARVRYLGWVEGNNDILDRSKDALRNAGATRNEMSATANTMAVHLKSLNTYYSLIQKVLQQVSVIEVASNFLASYDREAHRRLNATVGELIADYSSTWFLTRTADESISRHNTTALIQAETALLDKIKELESLSAKYNNAKARTIDYPRQNWLKYGVRWKWCAGAVAVPLLNLCCSLRFFFDVQQLKPGLTSSDPFYAKLRGCGRQVSATATGLSAAIAATGAGLQLLDNTTRPLLPEGVESGWVWSACVTYALTSLVFLAALIRLRMPPSGA
jgi:hypothetical protein